MLECVVRTIEVDNVILSLQKLAGCGVLTQDLFGFEDHLPPPTVFVNAEDLARLLDRCRQNPPKLVGEVRTQRATPEAVFNTFGNLCTAARGDHCFDPEQQEAVVYRPREKQLHVEFLCGLARPPHCEQSSGLLRLRLSNVYNEALTKSTKMLTLQSFERLTLDFPESSGEVVQGKLVVDLPLRGC